MHSQIDNNLVYLATKRNELSNALVYAGCLDGYDEKKANEEGQVSLKDFLNMVTDSDIEDGNYCQATIEELISALKDFFE
jgi:hypothetical protein